MKSTLIALALAAPMGLSAAAGPPVLLYGASKPEMYKYAFPAEISKVDSKEGGGSRQLVYQLKTDAWAGGGIGVDKLRLADYVAEGALEFLVRGAKGGEKIDIGFVQAKGLDPKDLAFQILAPLNKYTAITTKWQKVTIPLKDFPKEGSRWIESEQRRATGDFNWNRVSELVVSREPGTTPGFDTVAFANVQVVGSYDAAKVQAAAPKSAKPTGPVIFYSEGYSGDGGGAYAYPAGTAKLEEVPGGRGKLGLKATLITSAWSGGGIYRAPLDLSGYKDKGVLEVWAKGAKGGEDLYLGLVDKANGASVRLPLTQFAPGGLKKEWTKLQIPLKAFPKTGAKWDEASQKNLTFDFDWTKVSEVLFDNNGPNNNNGEVYLDDVAVKPAP